MRELSPQQVEVLPVSLVPCGSQAALEEPQAGQTLL